MSSRMDLKLEFGSGGLQKFPSPTAKRLCNILCHLNCLSMRRMLNVQIATSRCSLLSICYPQYLEDIEVYTASK